MKIPNNIKLFGDQSYRGDCPLESSEHITLVAEVRRRWPDTLGKIIIHPRNEGKRDYRQAMREQFDGLTAGASDIIIPGRPTLLIELKRKDHTKSRLPKVESEYLQAARSQGAYACIALGWEAGIEAIEYWRRYHRDRWS